MPKSLFRSQYLHSWSRNCPPFMQPKSSSPSWQAPVSALSYSPLRYHHPSPSCMNTPYGLCAVLFYALYLQLLSDMQTVAYIRSLRYPYHVVMMFPHGMETCIFYFKAKCLCHGKEHLWFKQIVRFSSDTTTLLTAWNDYMFRSKRA